MGGNFLGFGGKMRGFLSDNIFQEWGILGGQNADLDIEPGVLNGGN